MSVVTRFAPSPTGALHIGGVRTAIFNWLYARRHGGKFLLRIEDTDRARSTEESLEEILDSLKWLGLDWDGDFVKQSERLDVYQKYTEKLLTEGNAYKCYMSTDELTAKREEAKAAGKIFRYDRQWAEATIASGKSYAIRLLTPDVGSIDVEDAVRGVISFEAKDIDDFIIMKADGFPTYNFAVVVDDTDMGITHIIRGDDHLSNTPKQVLIYDAIGKEPTIFAHVSMILGADKAKLSKRHGAISVSAYREMGYLPEAVINYLVRLGWSHGDQEIFSKDELVEKFSLDKVGTSPAVFNPEKLLWVNGYHIRNMAVEKLAEIVLPLVKAHGIDAELDGKFVKVVGLSQERAKTLPDISDSIDYFYKAPTEYAEKARNKFLKPETAPVLDALIDKISALESFDEDALKAIYGEIMEAMELKMVKVAQPTRVALTGGTVSPGIFEVMEVLGRDEVIARLKRARAEIG